MKVVEHGPSIGEHMGKTIPKFIVMDDGRRYSYARVATADKDGGVWLHQLARDECIIAPGLVYRLAATDR